MTTIDQAGGLVGSAAGLLDRERTIAKAGFNRWLVPPAALCIHLCIGMAYGFSVFWLPLSRAIGITKSNACADMSLVGELNGECVRDTVGMSQLDAPDHEACLQSDAYVPTEVGNFLRNACAYVVAHGPIIRDGDTMDGPAKLKWQGFRIKEGRMAPPREVIRWFPQDQRRAPPELTVSLGT